jgi:DNA-binding NarL/FixJ family response regulator
MQRVLLVTSDSQVSEQVKGYISLAEPLYEVQEAATIQGAMELFDNQKKDLACAIVDDFVGTDPTLNSITLIEHLRHHVAVMGLAVSDDARNRIAWEMRNAGCALICKKSSRLS